MGLYYAQIWGITLLPYKYTHWIQKVYKHSYRCFVAAIFTSNNEILYKTQWEEGRKDLALTEQMYGDDTSPVYYHLSPHSISTPLIIYRFRIFKMAAHEDFIVGQLYYYVRDWISIFSKFPLPPQIKFPIKLTRWKECIIFFVHHAEICFVEPPDRWPACPFLAWNTVYDR